MSLEAMVWALNLAPVPEDDHAPSNTCAHVLLALANHADPEGLDAFPSVATLMRYTRLSRRTVRTALDRLEEAGIITRSDPAFINAKIKRTDRRPQSWDLHMELVRTDLSEDDLEAVARSNPMLRARIALRDRQEEARGSGYPSPAAPSDTGGSGYPSPGSSDPTGGSECTYEGQPVQGRGVATTPEPSEEPSREKSSSVTPTHVRVSPPLVTGPPAPVKHSPAVESPPGFEEFWSVWPRPRQGIVTAQRAWRDVAARVAVPEILAAAVAYRDDPTRTPPTTMSPVMWLHRAFPPPTEPLDQPQEEATP